MSTLLLFKFAVTPVLVAAMSVAARRFGPTVGGIIIGLPWMTGPVLFFLALEHGNAFLAEAARGALLAIPAIGAYAVAYTRAARRFSPLSCVVAGTGAFGVAGWLTSGLDIAVGWVALVAIAALLAARILIPPPRRPIAAMTPPWWDIPARMAATALLVGCIAAAANRVGPTLLGIVSSFPVIMTVITTFTHQRWGIDAATAMLRGIMLSLLGFVAFFSVVSVFASSLGLVPAYVAASLAGACVSVALVVINRARTGVSLSASR